MTDVVIANNVRGLVGPVDNLFGAIRDTVPLKSARNLKVRGLVRKGTDGQRGRGKERRQHVRLRRKDADHTPDIQQAMGMGTSLGYESIGCREITL